MKESTTVSEVRISGELRTEFGKGAARRARRTGLIPAVLYGHGTDPVHVSIPSLEFARIVRSQGANAVITLNLGEGGTHTALTKTVTTHPTRDYIEHVDLLLVRIGERLVVDVKVVVSGEGMPGSMITQEADTIQVEAEALHIPEQFDVSVAGAAIGFQVLAGQIDLPTGVTLHSPQDTLVVNVVAAPTAAQMESDLDIAGAGVVQDQPSTPEPARAGVGGEG